MGSSDRDFTGETGIIELISLVPFQNGFSVRKSSSDGKNHSAVASVMTRPMVSISINLCSFTMQLLFDNGSQLFSSSCYIFVQLMGRVESNLGYCG